MIYGKCSQLERYLGLCPALDTAIRYLARADLSGLAPGRNEVDGRYGDIHIMISGRERIGVSHVSQLARTAEREADDFLGFEGPVRVWCPMEEGDALIVFPEDAHMVKVQLDRPMPVSRAVVNVRV